MYSIHLYKSVYRYVNTHAFYVYECIYIFKTCNKTTFVHLDVSNTLNTRIHKGAHKHMDGSSSHKKRKINANHCFQQLQLYLAALDFIAFVMLHSRQRAEIK